ncbi:MAG: TfoX family protein [Chloroflexi bacterium]|nr:MAG: TfoX family protein [Chloroflexota bacterium]
MSAAGETTRRMFGGYGIFEGGKMFALVNKEGEIYLKVGDANRGRFEALDAKPHGRMPYYRIPDEILADDARLLEWVREAIAISKGAAK